jgi:uncharacterized protein with GYD domain
METYVILATFTQAVSMKADQAGEMMAMTQKTATDLGITITSWMMTFGRFDTLVTFQAPNAAAAGKFVMYLASTGLRTETLRAFPPEEAMGFLG